MLNFLSKLTGFNFEEDKNLKINVKQPKQVVLPHLVRHPFQVINISPYPFWIGFGFFGFMLWFGLFFLNAEWTSKAVAESFFDTLYTFFHVYFYLNITPLSYISSFMEMDYPLLVNWIQSSFLSDTWTAKYADILSNSPKTILGTIFSGSTLFIYIIDPFIYWLKNSALISILSFFFNLLDILTSSIYLDVQEYLNTGKSEFKSLTKFLIFLPAFIPVGCPFRFFTVIIGYKVIKQFIWIIASGIFLFMYLIIGTIFSFKITYYTIGSLMLASVVFLWKAYAFGCLIINMVLHTFISPLTLVILIASAWRWMSDISIESFRGEHTQAVQQNLLWGAYLFMLTEIIIFITLFQTTGYFWINPSVETSELWKFPGIYPPYTFGLGLANLILLLNSGWILQLARKRLAAYYDFLVYKRGGEKRMFIRYRLLGLLVQISKETNMPNLTNFLKTLQEKYSFDARIKKYIGIKKLDRGNITWSDRFLLNKLIKNSANYTLKTIILGTIFMIFQFIEYSNLSFSISSGIYGTCFYCLTGLHGFHVIVGILLLSICWWQFYTQTFVLDDSVFFWFSARYWQFVDFVWVGVWLVFYFDWSLIKIWFPFL